jgi:tetratricopeptide (TPR) repeat protein
MALWDKMFGKKKDEDPRHLNPIIQKNPPPVAAPRVSSARPVPKPVAPPPPPPPPPPAPKAEKSTRILQGDEQYLRRGLQRQSQGEHDKAIADFTKAIELNPNMAKAFAARGVSKEAKGDGAGAKSDYSTSIQIEIMGEINRQMRENPDVEV